ncbi:crossover junction endodeoxyribonuclease RuvC [bacterium]|nr:crossover junction endodeoxyribonuclease RuvC [bacterium]
MIVLGIDPGVAILGYAFLEKKSSKVIPLEYGVLTTEKDEKEEVRLHLIYNELTALMKKFMPDEMSVESLYFTNNQKTAFQVGQARGVVLLLAAMSNIPIFSYNPNQIKIAVTGYGRAGKKQVQEMVKRILGLEKIPKPDDAADAVAAALCHIYSRKIKVLK